MLRSRRLQALTVMSVLFTFAVALSAETPLEGLFAQEQRFAEMCKSVGIRDSFLAFFGDDVITFGPQMRVGTGYLKSRPANTASSPRLEWGPSYGDISADGNLGYTTGASTLTLRPDDPASTQVLRLIYFSIWRKNPTGEWKVIFDAGLSAPSAQLPKDFSRAPGEHSTPDRSLMPSQEALHKAEDHFNEIARTKGLRSALDAYADDQIRVLRDHRPPAVGIVQASSLLEAVGSSPIIPLKSTGIASSGDLGYAYGSSNDPTAAEGLPRVGYFVHVWKHKKNGWRIVFDMLLPMEER